METLQHQGASNERRVMSRIDAALRLIIRLSLMMLLLTILTTLILYCRVIFYYLQN